MGLSFREVEAACMVHRGRLCLGLCVCVCVDQKESHKIWAPKGIIVAPRFLEAAEGGQISSLKISQACWLGAEETGPAVYPPSWAACLLPLS